uniref:Uncharacterized protein n=1 Tax=Magallana gigas TaxID=29159 RepID=A0A8W8LRZ8_MAGGI
MSFNSPLRDEELISKKVFERMVDIVGTSHIVANRREIMSMTEVLNRSTIKYDVPFRTATSGSMGEGFRFEESDMDVMEYPDGFQVIWDHSQNQHKSFSEGEIYVFDGSHSPPGYGLLQILSPEELNSPPSNRDGISALVVRMTYVSMLQHVAFQLLSLKKEDYSRANNFDELSCLAIMQTTKLGSVSDLIFSAMIPRYRVQFRYSCMPRKIVA